MLLKKGERIFFIFRKQRMENYSILDELLECLLFFMPFKCLFFLNNIEINPKNYF